MRSRDGSGCFALLLVTLLLAISFAMESRAAEIHVGALASASNAAGYEGISPGIELLFDNRYLRLETAAHQITKMDGGGGQAYRALVGGKVGGVIIGLQVATITTDRYTRSDIWLVAQWAFLRAEIESESWRIEARPEFHLFKRGYIRPAVGFVSGRGSSGVVASLAMGYTW